MIGEKMDEEKNEEIQEEPEDNSSEDNREEETKDEIRDEDYVDDDEVEMLRSLEKKISALEEKIDNVTSMIVDAGGIVQESDVEISEAERDDYEDDFINIDDMDLSL